MSETHTRRAVLVDDNLMFAMMVEPQLRKLGYEVRTVATGPFSAEALGRPAPDLVLVNLTSSRFAAPELIRDLRSDPALTEVRIVGYAGHIERKHLEAGREAGADMVVPNSALRASLPEVLEKLEWLLAGGATEHATR